MPFRIDESKTTIYYGDIAFVKEKGFWAKHWLKFVVDWIILGLIATVYGKITGRDLGDDVEELGDRMEEAVDSFFDDIDK